MALRYTEDTIRGRIVMWMNEIIREEGLSFDRADEQIEIEGRRYPDIILWKRRRLEPALLIELKRPFYDPWDVAEEAFGKAFKAGVRFFATWNINKFFWWDRYKRGNLYDMLCGSWDVTSIRNIDQIDRVEHQIKSFLRSFLKEFHEIYVGRKQVSLMPLDERFIVRLRAAVDAFSLPVFDYIKTRWSYDPEFRENLKKWFVEQAYIFQASDEDFERVARQYVYLLINKIMFYNTLATKYRWLPKIYIRPGIRGEEFRKALQAFFNAALSIDYQTIFAFDFLDSIPPPDDLIEPLKRFIDNINRYDFSQIGYEILGRVFERLIPDHERHKLGQYYTRSDVVDLIVGFCVRKASDKVFDPACGAGTFLVRAYERKRFLDPSRSHAELLEELWGNDISKFASHLATINLASKDLSAERNYPRVLARDFFDLKPGEYVTILPYEVRGLDKTILQVRIPPFFDAVVMNPPYTRQEEMEDLLFPKGYKARLQKLVKDECDIGKRASIYAYFFIHGAKFLKNSGRLGLITSNSWLDVDYGKYLQEFFLKNFKIIAIIESKVERWFEDADINTCITILEKCDKKEERDNNYVKFVQLKKPLSDFIPVAEEGERWRVIEKFVEFIEKTNEYYEDDKLRIFPKKQAELWEERFTEESMGGMKWGKFLRAPNVFFKILKEKKELLAPLKEFAEVKFGLKTGANEFFYLTEEEIKKWNIEREFWMHEEGGKWVPNYVIKSPKECTSIVVNPQDLKYRVLMIHKDKRELRGTNVLKYIEWGEQKAFHKRPTCASRRRWYELEKIPGDLLCMMSIDDRHIFWYNAANALFDARLYGIDVKNKNDIKVLGALLNSTLTFLFLELWGRVNLGLGALDVKVYEYEQIPVINLNKLNSEIRSKLEKAFDELSKRKIGSVFEELGAYSSDEVSLHKVKPDRRKLDQIVMGEILGLSEIEQLEVYKAVIDLVKARIERAKSVARGKRKVKGIDIDALIESVLKQFSGELKRFPDDYLETSEYKLVTVPRGKAEVGSDLQGFYVRVAGEEIRCKSPYEAKYIQYAILNGHSVIKLPVDEEVMRKAVEKYESILRRTRESISEFLETTIPDRKLRERIKDIVWEKLWKGPLHV